MIVSYRFTKLPFTLAALSILWAVAASAAYVMFVGGTIISVEGREIVFRNDGGPGIKKDLGDIVKVRLKGNEKVWLASPLDPSDLTPGEWINILTQTDKTEHSSFSDQAHPLHAEKLEVPSHLPHPGTMEEGHADHVDYYASDRTLMVKGQIASIAKTGEGYMLTIPTPTNGNCRGCVQFVEVDGATSIVTYALSDVTALKPGLEISLSPLGKKGESDDVWETHTLLVGKDIITLKTGF